MFGKGMWCEQSKCKKLSSITKIGVTGLDNFDNLDVLGRIYSNGSYIGCDGLCKKKRCGVESFFC